MDASYRPKDVKGLLIPLGILVLLGILCRALFFDFSFVSWGRFLFALTIGAGCCVFLYCVDIYRFVRYSAAAYVGALVLLCVLVCSQANRFQAVCLAELSKLLPVLLCGLIYVMRSKGLPGLLLCGVSVACAALLLFFLPAFTSLLALVSTCLFVFTAASLWSVFGKRRFLPILITFGAVLLTGFLVCLCLPYLLNRLATLFLPELDPEGAGWLGMQIRNAVAGAQLWGAGAPAVQGFSHQMRSDFLFTILLQQYGWIPVLLLLSVFLVFIGICFYKAFRLKSLFGRLLASAAAASFAVRTLLYAAANMGFIIESGALLPFLALSNVTLVVDLALAGLLLSLFRNDGLYADTAPEPLPKLRISVKWEKQG